MGAESQAVAKGEKDGPLQARKLLGEDSEARASYKKDPEWQGVSSNLPREPMLKGESP